MEMTSRVAQLAQPAPAIEMRAGHKYLLDGIEADGVTSIIGDGVPKGEGLPRWAANTAAGYAIDNWETLTDLPLSQRLKTISAAPWNDRDLAARRGTEVHRLAEALLDGQDVRPPDELLGHVDAYLRFLAEWDVDELLTETFIGHRVHRYCGRLDLVARLTDGRIWLLDIKTTRSGVYGETALQLAGYRYAQMYVDADGVEHPMADVDATGVVWVQADGYNLLPVVAGPDEFRTFLYAQQVAHFTRRARTLVGEALYAPGQPS